MGTTPLRFFSFPTLFLCLTLGLATRPLAAAGSAGAIRGTVLGPDGKPMAAVLLVLRNNISGFHAETTTAATGPSRSSTSRSTLRAARRGPGLQAASPTRRRPDVDPAGDRRRSRAAGGDRVRQRDQRTDRGPARNGHHDLAHRHRQVLHREVPAAVSCGRWRTSSLRRRASPWTRTAATTFRARTARASTSSTARRSPTRPASPSPTRSIPGIAQSIEVIYGNVPAEFGEKVGAVINMTTKSAPRTRPGRATPDRHLLHFDTYAGGASVGTRHPDASAFFGSVDGLGLRLLHGPVELDNLNNTGNTQRAFLRLDAASPNLSNALPVLRTRRSHRPRRHRTPTLRKRTARTRQVKTDDQNYNLGWQDVLSADHPSSM